MANTDEKKEVEPVTEVAGTPEDVQAAIDYVVAFGQHLAPRDQHNAFVVQLNTRGWSYGATMDAEKKQHPLCRHWLHLPADDRALETELFNPKG